MIKRIIISSIILFCYQITFSNSINELREGIFVASYDESAYTHIKDIFPSISFESENQKRAYEATLGILETKYDVNLMDKYSELNRWTDSLNTLVEREPNNLELRFLRFSIEYHIPRLLPLQKHKEEDSQFISDHIQRHTSLQLSAKFKQLLYDFLVESNTYQNDTLELIYKSLF